MNGSLIGACGLCGHETPKAQMSRHLATCAPDHDSGSGKVTLVQFLIEASGAPEYWLCAEGREDASLDQLDRLLRSTWLECCDHMSAFSLRGVELAKRSRLGSVFRSKGILFKYEYDFGSTTALKGKVVALRDGPTDRSAVHLLARNTPLEQKCSSCTSPAELVCPLCIYTGQSFFCKKHARQHGCAEEDPFLPVVNSPRMGVCGYSG